MSLQTRLFLLVGCVLLGAVVPLAALNYGALRQALIEEYRLFVRSVAASGSVALDGADLEAIRQPTDTNTPAFARIRNQLQELAEANGLTEREVYILRPVGGSRFETEFVAMFHPNPFVGDRYVIREENRAAFGSVLDGATAESTLPYADEHGEWISGYAPIRNGAGAVVGVLEVDREVSHFLARAQGAFWTALGVGSLVLAVSLLVGGSLAAQVAGGLNRLTAAVRAFQAGDSSVRADIATHDEVGAVSRAFNEMADTFEEKAALLPFISGFTLEAVRRTRAGERWLEGIEVPATVLMTRLEGFARVAERMAPPDLLRALDGILAAQAAAVRSSGGEIDKYWGAGALAIFPGDERATSVQAAQAVDAMARAVSRALPFQAEGLGLCVAAQTGFIVLGAVGAPDRREFVAAGPLVDTARHLCSSCRPWEFRVTERFVEALSADVRAEFAPTAPWPVSPARRLAIWTKALASEPLS